jgi:hypothetical protein
MPIHPSRIVAGTLLVAGGFVVAVSALAVVLARLLVGAGMVVRPADAALLDDIVAILPFVIAFAVANLVAAYGLATGKGWAEGLAVGSAVVAVTVGALGLLLVIVGRDPFAPVGSPGSGADGIGILGAFTIVYLAVIVALRVARAPRSITTGVATA